MSKALLKKTLTFVKSREPNASSSEPKKREDKEKQAPHSRRVGVEKKTGKSHTFKKRFHQMTSNANFNTQKGIKTYGLCEYPL